MRLTLFKSLFASLIILLLLSACGPTATYFPPPTSAPASNSTEPLASVQPAAATQPPAASPTAAADVSKLAQVSTPNIQGLQMLDPNNGWALSETGVLRTADGGHTWHNAAPAGMSGRPNGSFFMDESHAWVIAASADMTSGTLYRTIDGGATWESISVPFGGASIDFIDPLTGWALAGLGYALSHEAVAVFRTSDGGITWSRVFTDDPTAPDTSDTLPFAGDKNGLTALDADHAWVAGSEPVSDFIYLYSTQDAGKTWSSQNPPLPAAFAGAMTNAYPPHFFNSTDGVLTVGVYADSPVTLLYLTKDGGKNWSAVQPVPVNGRVSMPSFTDFFVWDGGPSLYASQDSGFTWSSVNTNVNFPNELVSFQFVDPTTGWAVTSDANSQYKLYQTTNGGASWNVIVP